MASPKAKAPTLFTRPYASRPVPLPLGPFFLFSPFYAGFVPYAFEHSTAGTKCSSREWRGQLARRSQGSVLPFLGSILLVDVQQVPLEICCARAITTVPWEHPPCCSAGGFSGRFLLFCDALLRGDSGPKRHCRRSLTASTKVRVVPLPPMSGVFTESAPLLSTSSTAFCNLLPTTSHPHLSKTIVIDLQQKGALVWPEECSSVGLCECSVWVPALLQQPNLAMLPHNRGPTSALPHCPAPYQLPRLPTSLPAPPELLVVQALCGALVVCAHVGAFRGRGGGEASPPLSTAACPRSKNRNTHY